MTENLKEVLVRHTSLSIEKLKCLVNDLSLESILLIIQELDKNLGKSDWHHRSKLFKVFISHNNDYVKYLSAQCFASRNDLNLLKKISKKSTLINIFLESIIPNKKVPQLFDRKKKNKFI